VVFEPSFSNDAGKKSALCPIISFRDAPFRMWHRLRPAGGAAQRGRVRSCRSIRQFVVISALLYGLVGSAGAITTYSPPVRSDAGDNLGCFVQNLTDAALEVQTEINNGLGAVLDPRTFAVPAGQVLLFSRTTTAVFGAYCVFTFEGSPEQVRGFISLQDAGGSNTRLLYPARPIELGPPQLSVTTFSPPVRSSEGDNLGCKLLNLSDEPVQVVSELENGLGTVIDSRTFAVPAGQALLMARSNVQIFGGYCRFSFAGDPTAVRGYITLEDAGGSNTRLLYPAAPGMAAPPATFTPSEPAATPTATSVAGGCCGDCDGSGEVAINELITAVNNALTSCGLQ
jgi:hypothetical protein